MFILTHWIVMKSTEKTGGTSGCSNALLCTTSDCTAEIDPLIKAVFPQGDWLPA